MSGNNALTSRAPATGIVSGSDNSAERPPLVIAGREARRGALIVVGQCNPYHPAHGRGDLALFTRPAGSTGARLLDLARDAIAQLPRDTAAPVDVIHEHRWLALTDRHNLCDTVWSDPAARLMAVQLASLDYRQRRPVLLLGRRVADAWFHRSPTDGPTINTGAAGVWVIPHPSGRNRAWQQPGVYSAARAAVGQAVTAALAWGWGT